MARPKHKGSTKAKRPGPSKNHRRLVTRKATRKACARMPDPQKASDLFEASALVGLAAEKVGRKQARRLRIEASRIARKARG